MKSHLAYIDKWFLLRPLSSGLQDNTITVKQQ